MKNTYLLLLLFPSGLLAQSVSTDRNAVVSSKLRVATTQVADATDPAKALITIDYSDGLGRKIQSLGYRQSPESEDIVFSSIRFDQYGRPVREILASPGSQNSGAFKAGVTALAQSFYGEALPYSEITLFDNSPLNRTLESYGPGAAWRTQAGSPAISHSNRTVYTHNVANEVRLYVADVNGNITGSSSYYPAKSLYKTIAIDEQGDSSAVFKDVLGNTIESWQQVGSGQYAKTHFLYAHGDRLKAVMQPMAVAAGTDMSNSSALWKDFVFFYRYDNRGRVMEKKIPGAEPEYFVYDKWDRLVASQTGLQRDPSAGSGTRWSFFKYDALGREVCRGEYANSQDRSTLQAAVVSFESGKKHTFESRNSTAPVYYSLNVSFPTTITASDVRHISYFDSYTNWLPGGMSFDASHAWHSVYPHNTGDLTGSKSKKTEDGGWLVSASYFDNKNRLIQQFTQNTFGHTERTDFEYLFAGEVSKVRVVHKKPDGSSITELTENSYDHAGRLTLIKHGLATVAGESAEPADTLCTLAYDELGRLSEKKIRPQYQYYSEALDYIIRNAPVPAHTEDIYRRYVLLEPGFSIDAGNMDTYLAQTDSTLATTVMSGLQTINYGYHIRGMMDCVNCESGSPALTEAQNDLFSYKLEFETEEQWDGNIGKQSWKSKINPGTASYLYTYDKADRLTSASYTGGTDFSVPLLSYDLNGNILNLNRKGAGGFIDQLSYQYQGNRLLSVSDAVNGNPDTGDFRDGNTSGNDYTYWPDGSLKSDANKGISQIDYDSYLKKVKQVTYANGKWIRWHYDGQGGLLKRENSNGTRWVYSANAMYKNDTLYQLGFNGGRVVLDSNSSFNYRFEYRDIWNNLRLEFTAEDSVITVKQMADYDPLGFEFNHLVGVNANHFKYQNQERVNDFNLGVDFFKFRVSDPVIGRFWQVDPLSEQYAYNSVYAFQENKFGRGVELEGAELKEFFKWADQKLGQVLSYTDVDDATVIATHFTRGGNAIHADGTAASTSDKYWAAAGAALPVVSGGVAKKVVEAITNIKANQAAGAARETAEHTNLQKANPSASVQDQQYLRTADGKIAKDPLTGTGRRVDHVVIENGQAKDVVETTSQTADKRRQIDKEKRIREDGGTFIRDRNTKDLIDVSNKPTRISRHE